MTRSGGRGGLLPVLGALAAVFLALPLVSLLQRTPWSRMGDLLGSEAATEALWLSLQVAVLATVIATVLGVPLAWVLARTTFPGRTVVRALVLLPMVLPPVVGGVALLLAFGRRGIAGSALEGWFGFVLPFTTPGVIVAETYVAMPFFVLTVEAGLRSFDRRYAQAAATLGAAPWRTFRSVTLPMIAPSLRAGLVVAWARALGEFGATLLFAGSLAGRTQTLPLAIYAALESDIAAARAIALVLCGIAFALLVLLRLLAARGEP